MKIAGKDVTRAIAPGTVFVPMHWGRVLLSAKCGQASPKGRRFANIKNIRVCSRIYKTSLSTFVVSCCRGTLWAENSSSNALTHPESCPDSLQPELKACAVQLVPVAVNTLPNQVSLTSGVG
jgi:anaerobic selenocysteine-containing dehydrogenase